MAAVHSQAPAAVAANCDPLYVISDSPTAARPFELEGPELCRRFGARPVLRHPPHMSMELTDFVAEAGSQADLVILPPARLSTYVEANLLQPVTPWVREDDPWFTDILPAYRNLYMRFGQDYYGFVYDGDSHLLFYRQDLFDRLGLPAPTTWAEHDDIARRLIQTGGPEGIRYGTAIIGVSGKSYIWFVERYASLGGEYFDDQMQPRIDGALAVQVLRDLVALVRAVSPEAAYDWADLNRAFLSGNVPMAIQWSDTARFSFDQQVWQSKVSGKVGWALVPGGKPGAPRGGIWFGRILGVAARSRNPERAAQVALYMTGADVSGRMVVRADTINDPFRQSHFTRPEGHTLFPDPQTAASFLAVLTESLRRPMADLTIPGGWEYTQALDRAVVAAWRGYMEPAAALARAAAEWNEITARYGVAAQRRAFQDWQRRRAAVAGETARQP